jgi:hypothetical protein
MAVGISPPKNENAHGFGVSWMVGRLTAMGGMRCSIPSTLVPTTSFDKQSRVLFGSQFLDGLVCQLPCIALDKCNQFRPYMFKGLLRIPAIVTAYSGRS